MIDQLRAQMAAAASPEKAKGMQAYMKSAMPYYGLNLPEVRAIAKRVVDGAFSCAEWQALILDLWRNARYREERYAALYVLRARAHRACVTTRIMPMLEEMVISGAWWDYVDEIANVVGDLLGRWPRQIKPLMRKWSTDPNLWKRRVSIICQVGCKRDTDVELLYANIEPNLADRDFFIRKAIGWALRDYAWTDPKEIKRYVHSREDRLSGLSRREALKNLPARPSAPPAPKRLSTIG